MPQITKNRKFVFGKPLIKQDRTVLLPTQAVNEHNITTDTKTSLFMRSKKNSDVCIIRKSLVEPSTLRLILTDNPNLQKYASGCGQFIKYKGRFYCQLDISKTGTIFLTKIMMDFLDIKSTCTCLVSIFIKKRRRNMGYQ